MREVPEHVRDRSRRLGRPAHDARVIVVLEHSTMTPHHAVQRLREADGESLHAARKRLFVGRLDQEVDVVPLHGEVHEPRAEPLSRGCEGALDDGETAPAAEVPYVSAHSQRDIDRPSRQQLRPSPM